MLVSAPGLQLPLLMQKPLQTEQLVLDDEIQPLCPRHNLTMK